MNSKYLTILLLKQILKNTAFDLNTYGQPPIKTIFSQRSDVKPTGEIFARIICQIEMLPIHLV